MSHQHYVFSIPQSGQSRNRVKLRNAASARYGGDWSSIPHAHSYTELFYVVGGDGQFRIDNELFPVKANQLVVINPNIMHTEVSYEDHPLEYIVVGIEGPELRMHAEHDGRFCVFDVPETAPILACMQSILREMQNRQPDYDIVCQAYTEILIVQLARSDSFSIVDAPVEPQLTSQCASIRHYIESHYKERLTLEDLAAVAKVNKYYLSHVFRKEYGVPPINYMISCRIRESTRLLVETDLSLSEIAEILGFSSASYFSQSFRRAEAVSPTQYRLDHRKNC